MAKKKDNCRYELLCLINNREKNRERYERMISEINNLVGEKVEVEEKDFKPAYKINGTGELNYILIKFTSKRLTAKDLDNEILKACPKELLNRYMLINLDSEKKNKVKSPIKKKEND
jgi:ribosomal protein S6